jgi:hypothetical protein
VFFALWSLRPGAYWMPDLAAEVEGADAFVLLAANSGLGPWQLLEYYAAMDRHARLPEFLLIPAVVGKVNPDAPFLRTLGWLRIASAETAGPQIAAAIDRKALPDASLPWRFTNPYRGLNSFREADADSHFGREALTRRILDVIRTGARIVLLVGNSGVGKSSLAEAGLVASLRRQRVPCEKGKAPEQWPHDLWDSRSWLYLRFLPRMMRLRP